MSPLLAFGSNGSGQLGIGHRDDVAHAQPTILPAAAITSHNPPTRIAAGGNHTLLLLASGDLLWAGDPTTGACGRLDTTPATIPQFRPVDLPPALPPSTKIALVAATWEASIIATRANQVLAFGRDSRGALGLGVTTLHAASATTIPDFPPPGTHLTDLAAGMGHVVAVLSNGEAWGWGNGRKGQLGEPPAAAVCSPRRIAGVGFKVARAVCGREFTCLFGAAATGELAVLGSDKGAVRSQAPQGGVVGWKEVGAGWGSVFMLKGDGTLVSWGRDDHGQLSPGDIGQIKHIAVGSEHALALTEAGELVAWGWGEHGNCGPIRHDTGQRGQRNQIALNKALGGEQGMEITMIGAGCATSWIAVGNAT
ncbi:RCC1/BLIP-II [Trichocladium antarcticum]|uniref:RCC1/BLIP-II n=1 Tax=Trichocladium antarcticum TaxID=1450529 RepID=A0AAN6ZG72_9PEZI|nr:RCC1/BLIP-II [Trichocladium antarcticum]